VKQALSHLESGTDRADALHCAGYGDFDCMQVSMNARSRAALGNRESRQPSLCTPNITCGRSRFGAAARLSFQTAEVFWEDVVE
jgi:hypothetical protein